MIKGKLKVIIWVIFLGLGAGITSSVLWAEPLYAPAGPSSDLERPIWVPDGNIPLPVSDFDIKIPFGDKICAYISLGESDVPAALSSTALEKMFKEAGFLNNDMPLYDLTDEKILEMYTELAKSDSIVVPTDFYPSPWQQIKEAVDKHIEKHGDNSLIIISGEGCHIWGAVPDLEKKHSAAYLSLSPVKLNVDFLLEESLIIGSENEALAVIKQSMADHFRVVKYLKYNDISAFLNGRARPVPEKNIIVGIEDSSVAYSPHLSIYSNEMQKIYRTLTEYIGLHKPKSILYLRLGLEVKGCYEDLEAERAFLYRSGRDEFLIAAKKADIPVEFAGFYLRE